MVQKIQQNLIRITVIVILIAMVNACTTPPSLTLSKKGLIPIPVEVKPTFESFEISAKTKICTAVDNEELNVLGMYLKSVLNPSTGFDFPIVDVNNAKRKGQIILKLDEEKTELGEEGYELEIGTKNITITAKKSAGVFRGIQTLRQLLPAEIESDSVQPQNWYVASGTIRDLPRYSHRGVMLDVVRHFFSVEDVKRFIDLIAYYKINTLHLHLSDDQGWRIEIKSWPKLTEIGGSTEVGGGEGGFFTQEEYLEIIDYAAKRYITIIPEIDMPGHTNAALASYPELNCDNVATKLYTGTRVGFSSLCIHKEITYTFVDDVIKELASLTPGQYIHIGGDESHSTKHTDFVYFINRVKDIVKKYNKTMIGWDEIAHADIDASHFIQYWSNAKNAKLGTSKGAKVIMSPAKHAYLDMKYDSTTKLGLDWAGHIEVDKAYNWNPDKLVDGLPSESILGVEAPLWAETIETIEDIEYLAFPRIPGYAEIGWSPDSLHNWDEYRQRLSAHKSRFEIMGINYYKSPKIDW